MSLSVGDFVYYTGLSLCACGNRIEQITCVNSVSIDAKCLACGHKFNSPGLFYIKLNDSQAKFIMEVLCTNIQKKA